MTIKQTKNYFRKEKYNSKYFQKKNIDQTHTLETNKKEK